MEEQKQGRERKREGEIGMRKEGRKRERWETRGRGERAGRPIGKITHRALNKSL